MRRVASRRSFARACVHFHDRLRGRTCVSRFTWLAIPFRAICATLASKISGDYMRNASDSNRAPDSLTWHLNHRWLNFINIVSPWNKIIKIVKFSHLYISPCNFVPFQFYKDSKMPMEELMSLTFNERSTTIQKMYSDFWQCSTFYC